MKFNNKNDVEYQVVEIFNSLCLKAKKDTQLTTVGNILDSNQDAETWVLAGTRGLLLPQVPELENLQESLHCVSPWAGQ